MRREKLDLLKNLERGGTLVVNGEDPYLNETTGGDHRVVRAGLSGTVFETPLAGRHNLVNAQIAAAVARALGLDAALIQRGLLSFKPVPGRLFEREIAGIAFMDDTYNSNPVSFEAAIETLGSFRARGKKGVVCGDMLELGAAAEPLHRRMGARLAELSFDFVIAAGPLSAALVDEAVKKGFDPARIRHVTNAEEAGRLCREWASPGDRILVKGSRGMQMEKVFECFITSSIR